MLNIIEAEEAMSWWAQLSPEWQTVYSKLFGYNPEIPAYGYFGSQESPIPMFCEYRYMSNFHLCPVMHDGILYGSSEAAYQAAKTEAPDQRLDFTKMTPGEAMRQGRARRVRDGWDKMKVGVMKEILSDKFDRNPHLMRMLRDTAGKPIEETNWWGDRFWGVCKGKGENNLGKILMELRS